MFNRKVLFATTFVIFASIVSPHAASAQSTGISVGLGISTLGGGTNLNFKLQNNLNLRLDGNYLSLSHGDTYDSVPYDLDIDLRSVGAVLDLHPFGNGFHVSGGVYWNGNRADLSSTPSSNVTVGNTTYTAAQVGSLRGELEYNSVAPYVGLGYDSGFKRQSPFSFSIRAGLFYMGEAKVNLSSSGTLSGNAAFQADLAREVDTLEDDLDVFGFYPAISVGVRLRF